MKSTIDTETAVAYSQCLRKAFLLLFSRDDGEPHEYVEIVKNQIDVQRAEFLNSLQQKDVSISVYNETLRNNSDIVVDVKLRADDLEAHPDVLRKTKDGPAGGYDPVIIVGTQSITKDHMVALAFAGYVLGQTRKKLPAAGSIIGMGERGNKIKLASHYRAIRNSIDALREWRKAPPPEPPPVILNRHCPYCQFRHACMDKAEKEDNLTLLDRMTPKLLQRYRKKGIFTVTQLSYVYRPRRNRKRTRRLAFNVELQALAIRTGKIYLVERPELPRQSAEYFLDLEGIPDLNFQYLFGLLACVDQETQYYSFWADTVQDEKQAWLKFLAEISKYPEAPIYHYGSYEPRAIDNLAEKYQVNCEGLKKRLINLSSQIYAKVYFPVRSNRLKDLGKFLGLSWTSPDASGLQSLVWRHRWEETRNDEYQQKLLTYNQEDCQAVRRLANELSNIQTTGEAQSNVDFADRPKNNATEIGSQIQAEFKQILKSGHFEYKQRRLNIRSTNTADGTPKKKVGGQLGHAGYTRITPRRVGKVICVAPRRQCWRHKGKPLEKSDKIIARYVTDLVFTKNGCRKTVTKYIGNKAHCKECQAYRVPPAIEKLRGQMFGHGFQAWTIYQRVVLRLSFRNILQAMEDLFNERIGAGTLIRFMSYFAKYYASTEKILTRQMLESSFIHVDETRLNVQGANYYVWVFADEKHVFFKLTDTREAVIVHEILAKFKGVLVSDFYGGYDSVTCKQQKCWAHLIRDLNEDLWSNPFDREFELFTVEVKTLISPIFAAVNRYGLKKRNLNKFRKSVEKFYQTNIVEKNYKYEPSMKYQKRFQRYRESLFTFLEQDSIPWNNNTAERAIRHLAVQRKISGSFFERAARQYLVLLGIAQTCKFQNKSFLKFLMSGEKDVDRFKASRPLKIAAPMNLKHCPVVSPATLDMPRTF